MSQVITSCMTAAHHFLGLPILMHAKLFPISEKAKTCIPLSFIQLSIIKQLLLHLVFTDI